jgi:hypothetical protein
VGCCDSSPAQHASAHARASGHPLARSFEPGESWFWDYVREDFLEGLGLAEPTSHPADQPVPGPRGRVPADWQQRPGGPETSVAGVALDGVATAARYTCGGRGYYRATVGSTFLVRRDGVNARPEDAVRDFGPLFATSFYGAGATTSATAPAPLTVGAQTGSTSLVTVTQPASSGCPDLVGRITVVALPTSRKGASGGTGVLLLVVQHDAAGGPATPAPVDDHAVAEILSSVRVTP